MRTLPTLFVCLLAVGGAAALAQDSTLFGRSLSDPTLLDQPVGFSLSLAPRRFEGFRIRFSAVDIKSPSPSPRTTVNGVSVIGTDAQLNLTDRITLSGEWAETIARSGRAGSGPTYQSNAFSGNVGYKSGPLDVRAGYRYIDPLFYAPGQWAQIGNWLNPTNIQGPTFRAAYDFSSRLGLNVGGDYFTGARDGRSQDLMVNEDISRILVGLRWDVAKNFHARLDWERLYYTLDNSRFGGTGLVHPTEHYITLGTGYNLTRNTLLRLNYQVRAYDAPGMGAAGSRYNFNSITGQLNVKF